MSKEVKDLSYEELVNELTTVDSQGKEWKNSCLQALLDMEYQMGIAKGRIDERFKNENNLPRH